MNYPEFTPENVQYADERTLNYFWATELYGFKLYSEPSGKGTMDYCWRNERTSVYFCDQDTPPQECNEFKWGTYELFETHRLLSLEGWKIAYLDESTPDNIKCALEKDDMVTPITVSAKTPNEAIMKAMLLTKFPHPRRLGQFFDNEPKRN